MTDPLIFALAVLVVLATPGPTNTLLMTSGALAGVTRSLRLLVAELAGYNIGILATGFLIKPLSAITPRPRLWLCVAAVIYLCVLAVRLWRQKPDTDQAPVQPRHVFVTTLLNPKVLVFALLIIPLDDPRAIRYMAAFSGMLVLIGASWITLGAIGGRLAGSHFYKFVPKVAAVVLVVFANFLLWSALIS